MIIERTEDELIFKLPIDIGTFYLDKIAKYLKYAETNSDSEYDEVAINQLADESKNNWWIENQSKFIK